MLREPEEALPCSFYSPHITEAPRPYQTQEDLQESKKGFQLLLLRTMRSDLTLEASMRPDVPQVQHSQARGHCTGEDSSEGFTFRTTEDGSEQGTAEHDLTPGMMLGCWV